MITPTLSRTSLQQRLVKTGGRLVKHARYYWLLLVESHRKRRLFRAMVRRMRNFLAYCRLFLDFEFIQNFRRMRNCEAVPRVLSAMHLVPLRSRVLGGNVIFCRPKTTDFDVFVDTFMRLYHLPPKDLYPINTILDLGSNIGTTMAHYATLYPNATILGIELDGGNFELCRKNISTYSDRCQIILGAVWSEDGEVAYTGDAEWGFHVPTVSRPRPGEYKGTVKAYGMSSLIEQLGNPLVDFVKMDVEGAEKQLLQNADSWIGRVRCLKIEVHSPYTVEECIEDLRRVGLDCELYLEHHACVIARNRKIELRG